MIKIVFNVLYFDKEIKNLIYEQFLWDKYVNEYKILIIINNI